MCATNEEKLKKARQEAWDAFEKMIDAHLQAYWAWTIRRSKREDNELRAKHGLLPE